jgi:hypothetical protein
LPNLARKLAASAALIAFAGAVLASGLDRLADGNPDIPALLHWAYALNGPFNAAQAAIAGRHDAQAVPLMAQALDADPVDEAVIGGLGQARLLAGDAAGADAAFRVSVQRGWRDGPTHSYWLARSIAFGDFAAASIHADALLRQPRDPAARDQVLFQMLDYDPGRDALAARLRLKPSWQRDFPAKIDNQPVEVVAAIADVATRAGPGLWPCRDTVSLINRLVDTNQIDDARKVYRISCPAGPGLVHDARFQRWRAEGQNSSLDWTTPDSADAVISPVQAATTGLEIAVSRGVSMRVLSQRVPAPAGTYRLTWRMPGTPAADAHDLVAGFDCALDLGQTHPGAPVNGVYSAVYRFDGSCLAPTLAFWVVPPGKVVTVDDVTLVRVDK